MQDRRRGGRREFLRLLRDERPERSGSSHTEPRAIVRFRRRKAYPAAGCIGRPRRPALGHAIEADEADEQRFSRRAGAFAVDPAGQVVYGASRVVERSGTSHVSSSRRPRSLVFDQTAAVLAHPRPGPQRIRQTPFEVRPARTGEGRLQAICSLCGARGRAASSAAGSPRGSTSNAHACRVLCERLSAWVRIEHSRASRAPLSPRPRRPAIPGCV
jgi:hypothetical protein